jgi:hypothetical protein
MDFNIWKYAGDNTNAHAVQIGPLTLYFSYKTLVAFYYKRELVICRNIFGRTTGKHIAAIYKAGTKIKDVPYEEFLKLVPRIEIYNLREQMCHLLGFTNDVPENALRDAMVDAGINPDEAKKWSDV